MSSVYVSVENGLVDWRMEESTITLAAWHCCYSHLAACVTREREEDEKMMSSAVGVVAEKRRQTQVEI